MDQRLDRHSLRRPLASLAAASLLMAGVATAANQAQAAPVSGAATVSGAVGVGDSLYPRLGNGGYNVSKYDLSLKYATSAPSQGFAGTVTITATASADLKTFNLDYAGTSVTSIYVNSVKATFTRDQQDLVITPKTTIKKSASFTVKLFGVAAKPTVSNPDDYLSTLFFYTQDGSATAPQPDGFHYLIPSNDHPRDKATFTFALDVPKGITAVANGTLTSTKTTGSRTVFTYSQAQPMATELVQLAVGKYKVYNRASHNGIKIRDVVPTRLASPYSSKFTKTNSLLDFMSYRAGAYPFPVYGGLVTDADTGFSLETQTLSLFPTSELSQPAAYYNTLEVHELSHSWFGNSVSPYRWADIWLNEGHATYYEWRWASDNGALPTVVGLDSFLDLIKDRYEHGNAWRATYGPVGQPKSGSVYDLYTPQQYDGGALVLFALYKKVGATKFAAIEKKWTSTYKGKSASTAQFISLAGSVYGQSLTTFLKEWIYGTTTPPMPGYPTWNPGAQAASSSAASDSKASVLKVRH